MTESIAWYVFHGIVTAAWVVCVGGWIKRGCRFPGWLHVFAGGMFFAGLLVMTVLNLANLMSLNVALACLTAPPAAAYIGWLWMFGPWMSEEESRAALPETVKNSRS